MTNEGLILVADAINHLAGEVGFIGIILLLMLLFKKMG